MQCHCCRATNFILLQDTDRLTQEQAQRTQNALDRNALENIFHKQIWPQIYCSNCEAILFQNSHRLAYSGAEKLPVLTYVEVH